MVESHNILSPRAYPCVDGLTKVQLPVPQYYSLMFQIFNCETMFKSSEQPIHFFVVVLVQHAWLFLMPWIEIKHIVVTLSQTRSIKGLETAPYMLRQYSS